MRILYGLSQLVGHAMASLSTECSLDKPPASFVSGQESTMRDNVCRSPQAQLPLLYHFTSIIQLTTSSTRHRASTSMYSLTFCVRFLLPERHQWKPAVQAAAVMLRTPPPYAARGIGGAPRRTPVAGRSHYVVISRDGRKLVTRVRVMLP